MQNVATFLMFEGKAEEAMKLYTSVVPNSSIIGVARYAKNEPGTGGSIKHAGFMLGDQLFACIDSPGKHQFSFTSSVSIFITCDSEAETDELFTKLSVGGNIMMPLNTYPFSKRFVWFSDKFGVSWQLSFNP